MAGGEGAGTGSARRPWIAFNRERGKGALREHPADPGFAGDPLAARTDMRASFSEEAPGRPGG